MEAEERLSMCSERRILKMSRALLPHSVLTTAAVVKLAEN